MTNEQSVVLKPVAEEAGEDGEEEKGQAGQEAGQGPKSSELKLPKDTM